MPFLAILSLQMDIPHFHIQPLISGYSALKIQGTSASSRSAMITMAAIGRPMIIIGSADFNLYWILGR